MFTKFGTHLEQVKRKQNFSWYIFFIYTRKTSYLKKIKFEGVGRVKSSTIFDIMVPTTCHLRERKILSLSYIFQFEFFQKLFETIRN